MNGEGRPASRPSSAHTPRPECTRSPGRSSVAALEHHEAEELYALILEAWELKERESPYVEDAAAGIVAWARRRPLAALERRQEADAQVTRIRAELERVGLGRAAA